MLQEKLRLLEPVPGCYLMKNNAGEIIYVGKAKRLSMRVPQYFTRPHEGKTQRMVGEISDFDTIITSSEREALILEMNLIHLHNPRYNIMLKDNRSYPYVQLKYDKAPFLRIARSAKDRNARSYGPYPDATAAYTVLALLQRLFPLRKCKTLPKKPCLYYHLGQCLAPCIRDVQSQEYEVIERQIDDFMRGKVQGIKQKIQQEMHEQSERMEYEQALENRNLLTSIDYVSSRQNVQFKAKVERDVFAFYLRDELICIAVLIIRNGILITKHTDVFPCYGDAESAFVSYLTQYYETNLVPKEIILPNIGDLELLRETFQTQLTVPIRGDKFALLQMGADNARKGMEERFLTAPQLGLDRIALLERLSELLGIALPYQIELLDNSHLQGENAASAVVVFQGGEPQKKLYRRYRLVDGETRDDAGNIYTVIKRRYERILKEQQNMSHLILVDGGVSQVHAAEQALLELGVPIPVAGLVKNNRHQTASLYTTDAGEISLHKDRPLYFLLARMQDEVHRFAITYHRKLRSKSMISSILDVVPGLGPKRKNALLKAYGTIEAIRQASVEELSQYVPIDIAEKLHKHLLEHDS
jgi:excinuclease ABC subunit C